MFPGRWPISLLTLVFAASCAGCTFPIRQSNSLDSTSWNPFARPDAKYLQQAEAEEEITTKKVSDPNLLKLRYAMWMEETGNLPEAQKHYAEVLAARPKDLEAVLGVARTDLATGNLQKAEQGFHRALKLDPNSAIAHSGIGQCRSAEKDWTTAVDELTKASRGEPEDRTIRYHLAVALVHTGNLPAAQIQFSHCVGEAAGYYNIALILKDEGRLEDAESQLVMALRKDPSLKDAERWLTEIRRVRISSEQASLRGPAEIKPAVTRATYRDYGPVGTVEIEPAEYIAENSSPATQPGAGHSSPR